MIKALLALDDGTLFYGSGIGAHGTCTGEVIFNTAMTGYQEVLTDPSYYKQLIAFTHPHIGNVGVNATDEESKKIYAHGVIMRDLSRITSSWRAEKSLQDYLLQHQITGIADIDTRALTRKLRINGAMQACIMFDNKLDANEAIQQAISCPKLLGQDLAKAVSTDEIYQWKKARFEEENPHIVVYDFGVKHNILHILDGLNCQVTVVPADTSAQRIFDMQADGVLLSNGPGDPEPCQYAIEAIKQLISKPLPILGICLGHQLLAIAMGAKTVKMQFGHHGSNHPIKSLSDNTVSITSQNHCFTVDEATLPEDVVVTYRSLFDNSIQGIQGRDLPLFGIQGHPEGSPGPHDIHLLFRQFVDIATHYGKNHA